MPVPDSHDLTPEQRRAAAALLGEIAAPVAGLARRFTRHGHELALVGGSVRDVFLGRGHGDLDLTTDARPEQVLKLAEGWADAVWEIGIDFGTVGLRRGSTICEITTYRSESYRYDSRKPKVDYGTSLTDDLSRRDFTVNAMAARLPSLELADPFGGLADLRAKLLRTPGRAEDSFTDDPLRILRAARFTAQLDFTVTAGVREAMTALAPRLAVVSAERIRDELTKLMLAPGLGPVRGIALLVDTGVADQVLPEVPRLRLEADEHFRHKDVYQHSLTVLEQAIALEPRYGLEADLRLRLAALLHDIGKPKTRRLLPDGRVAFHHHEVVGASMARARLSQLRFPKDVVNDVATLVALHLRFHGYNEGGWTDSAVRRYVRDAGPLLTRLHALTRADCTTRNRQKAARLARAYDDLEERITVLSEQEELEKIRPDLDGNQIMEILGVRSGPVVGDAYRYLLDLRMERGPLGTERAAQELRRWAEAEGLSTGPADGSSPPGGRGGRPAGDGPAGDEPAPGGAAAGGTAGDGPAAGGPAGDDPAGEESAGSGPASSS
ncbi:MAG TPA: CCA tRNA nucleotidyltransferase [Streptosporangiaceae bacterium]|nr:CCA tRNA nucleotidyltransferase [Streptosporangiaceae bacterium]